MNRRKKWRAAFIAAALAVVGWGLGQKAEAIDYDTMVVSVTPLGTGFGVTITSVNPSGYQFGNVQMGATTQSTSAILVQNSGTLSEYFTLAITTTSGNWTPVTAVPAIDQYRMIPYFNATEPLLTDFQTTDALTWNLHGSGSGRYNQGAKTNAGNSKNLWLRLEMPSGLNSGGTGQQTMTLTVNGQGT